MDTSEMTSDSTPGIILFIAFFILYALEFVSPLIRKRSRHFLSNITFAAVLTSVNFLFTSITFTLADWVDKHDVGIFQQIESNAFAMVVVSIVFLDFWAGYLVHLVFHKFSWLWQLHSIHHTDELVDVTTTFRQHPIESIIRIFFHLSGMVMLGIPLWVLVVYLTLSTINAQIEHANIRIPAGLDRILQYVIVTPNMHKIHHSKYQHETDSNYSNIFSFWDRIFRTYRSLENYAAIHYGLDYMDGRKQMTFWELIKLPFMKGRSG